MSKLPPGDLHVKFDLVESDLCSLWLADTNQGPTLELHTRIEEPVLWLWWPAMWCGGTSPAVLCKWGGRQVARHAFWRGCLDDPLWSPHVGHPIYRCTWCLPDSFPGIESCDRDEIISSCLPKWSSSHSPLHIWQDFFMLAVILVLIVHVDHLLYFLIWKDVMINKDWNGQTAPLDLDTDAFYAARQPMIEARLHDICKGKASEILAQSWSKFCGTLCRGVNWDKYSLEVLQTIAACIRGPGLSAICRLLAVQHGGWTAGMPDLLLWRTY